MLNLTLDTLYITKIRAHTASMLLIAKYSTMLEHTLVTSGKVRTWWKVVTNTLGSPSPSFIWAHSKITNPLYTRFFTFSKIFNGELSPITKSFKIQVGTSLGVAHAEYGVNRPKKSGVPPCQNCVGSIGTLPFWLTRHPKKHGGGPGGGWFSAAEGGRKFFYPPWVGNFLPNHPPGEKILANFY